MPKVIAVVPVYNESKTLAGILKRISLQVDLLVCVNDGSKDDSLAILRKFAAQHKKTFVVNLPVNRGMAGALKSGFLFILYLEKQKLIKTEDVVVTIDADGQHKPEYICEIVKFLIAKKVDVLLTRRDFSVYPRYKIWGNRFLTWTNSILSGFAYNDVESGLRLLRVKTLRSILKFYTGMRYSCAQEIALISAREGYKIDNGFVVDIAYYRPGTTVWDGFIVLFLSFVTYLRWLFKLSAVVSLDSKLLKDSLNSSRQLWSKSKK